MTLDVNQNRLNGTIPTEIGRLRELLLFRPRLNRLSGAIPSELALIGAISADSGKTFLFRTNKTNSFFAVDLTYSLQAVTINARANALNGTFPSEILGMRGLGKTFVTLIIDVFIVVEVFCIRELTCSCRSGHLRFSERVVRTNSYGDWSRE